MQKDYLELVKKLDSKINDVEKLIQLLLINNLIDDVEDTIDISKKCIDERVNEEILKNGRRNIKSGGKPPKECRNRLFMVY